YVETDPFTTVWNSFDKEWLASLVDSSALSVSALNEYLACPVSFVSKRLIRIPSLPTRPLVLGPALPAAMERVHRDLNKDRKLPTAENLFSVIDSVVYNMPLSQVEVDEISAKAKTLVSEYYDSHQAEFHPSLSVEKNIGVTPPVAFEGLHLVGK